jgi:hypothetical protein
VRRTGQQRLDDIPRAIARGHAFQERVKQAAGHFTQCADLMAEAIEMHREARGLEVVNKSGKVTLCMEELQAVYCLDAACAAYLLARKRERP